MKKPLLFIGDIIILYIGLYATLLIRYGGSFNLHTQEHLTPFTIIFLVWLVVFYILNLYEIESAKNNIQFYRNFFYGIGANAFIALAFFYLVPYFVIAPKINLLIFFGVATALLLLWRMSFNKILAQNKIQDDTLIIGASKQSLEIYDFLLKNPQLGYNAIGILDVKDKEAIKILKRLIVQKGIKVLVLAPEAYKIPDIIEILYSLLGLQITFYSLTDFYEHVTGRIPLGSIDQGWFINNISEGTKKFYEALNRIIDIIGAVIIGIISLILYPFVAIAIKTSSPGPVFFKQKRLGKTGKPFTLIKFRSMVANAPDGSAEGKTGAVWTRENDPRITKIGAFLRKTRIDELPQVWNVLKGEMSFVGPRSERPEFHEELKRQIPFYEERYLIRPGLTGWSQLKFGYGSSVEDAREKLQYDLYYIKNRSILFDLAILLKTILIVLKGAGR